jgi:hypothetical protein
MNEDEDEDEDDEDECVWHRRWVIKDRRLDLNCHWGYPYPLTGTKKRETAEDAKEVH